jgi:ABC-2 type transport system ATP-binding protein
VLILKQGRIVHYANLARERSVNQRFVEIETSGDSAGLAEDLTEIGCTCTIHRNGRLKMVVPQNFNLRDIYRVAAQRDLPLRRLNYRRDTLEDIFLAAMEA